MCALAVTILFALPGLPASVAGQDPDSTAARVPLHGIVYDAFTGAAVAGAAVYLDGEGYGVLSDSAGVFRFADVPPGSQLVAAIQFGYEETAAPVEVPEDGAFIEIELTPQPILLDGVTAVVDNISTMERRMQTRRRAVPYQARAFGQERLLRSASSNILDFLLRETQYGPVPCPVGYCVIRRGRMINPRVYIDEMPAIGGMDELESYPTAQIYALEVYSQGAEIRAYTYNFMQRMAEKPMVLVPLNLWP